VNVFQSDAAPGPISLSAAAVDKYFPSEGSILGRSGFPVYGRDDAVALSPGDQPVSQTPFRIWDVGVTEFQRDVEPAFGILETDVEVPFRSAHVPGSYLVLDRIQSECHAVCPNDLTTRVEAQLPFALYDEDSGFDEREL